MRIVGEVVKFEIENSQRRENVDHVYVTVEAGLQVPLTLSLNTLSSRGRVTGHDPHIRLGTFVKTWARLPSRGAYPMEFFDYDTAEIVGHTDYRVLGREALEEYFALRCGNCRRIEAWGQPYTRVKPGLHQIHSRRASSAVPKDLRGHDGAVRFYFDEGQRCELALLKFCGQ